MRWALIFLFSVGCTVVTKRLPSAENSEDWEYSRAQKLFQENKYADAAKELNEYIQKHAVSEHTLSAWYLAAKSEQFLHHDAQALFDFHQVLSLAPPQNKSLVAQSFFYMSFSYEAQGKNAEMLATLVDAVKRSADLPETIVQAELPARIALAYAQAGNFNEASKYFERAEHGIKILERASAMEVNRAWLAQTMLAMGKSTIDRLDPARLTDDLVSVSKSQQYLLRAVEMSVGESSQQAVDSLTGMYARILAFLKQLDSQDQHLPDSEIVNQRVTIARAAADLLDEAKDEGLFMILGPRSSLQESLAHQLDSVEHELTLLLYQGSTETMRTQEAEAREGILRKGRVLDPKGRLERIKKSSSDHGKHTGDDSKL